MNQQNEIENLQKENEALKQKLADFEAEGKNHAKFKGWLGKLALRFGTNFIFGKSLIQSGRQFVSEAKSGKINPFTISDIASKIFYRITRIGLFAFIVALIPGIILIFQTVILSKQNEKIDLQNKLVTNQNYLLEADRRGSLVHLFNNVLDKVDEEIKDSINNPTRKLSPQLIGRIVVLSHALKPYQYLEGDSLSNPLSPERGFLLIALQESKLDNKTYIEINFRSNFSFSDLRNANLRNTNLSGTYLRNSDLRNANFKYANLEFTTLAFANLRNANLENVNLANSDLENANFAFANLNHSDLRNVYLARSNLLSAFLFNSKCFTKTWFEDLQKMNQTPIGLDNLTKIYYVDSTEYRDESNQIYYLIKVKKN